MRPMIRCGVALAAAMGLAGAASAWNRPGHMATGAVAYRVLKAKSPATIPKVIALLEKHPYYEKRKTRFDGVPGGKTTWKEQVEGLNPEARAEHLFMWAARWPDDARDDEDFYPQYGPIDFGEFHYVNLPFKPDGVPDSVKPRPPADINLRDMFPILLRKFAKRPRGENGLEARAVAMCWIIHLIGDTQQPLHTSALYTQRFPRGDRGGTVFYVWRSNQEKEAARQLAERTGDGSKKRPPNLHQIWDGAVTSEMNLAENREEVGKILELPQHAPAQLEDSLAQKEFASWIAESFELAKTNAYVFNGELLEGGFSEDEALVLDAEYLKAIKPVAQRRVVLAGHRIASTLQQALGGD